MSRLGNIWWGLQSWSTLFKWLQVSKLVNSSTRLYKMCNYRQLIPQSHSEVFSSRRHNLISEASEYFKSSGVHRLLILRMCLLYIQMWRNTSTKWFEADIYNLTLSEADLLPPTFPCNWAFRESGKTIWPLPCRISIDDQEWLPTF